MIVLDEVMDIINQGEMSAACQNLQGSLLLTWINSNPIMNK